MRESDFQRSVVKELRELLGRDETHIIRGPANRIQGIPDILILHKDRWVALEFKRSANAKIQPNQEYYISQMNGLSYAAFIHPENKEEVLNEVQQALGVNR